LAALASTTAASAQNVRTTDANGNNLDAMIAMHAAANNVPVDLVRRVIKRESGGNPRTVSQGNYGLMQIKLGTARSMGYRGTAAGLLDADTNMTYAVKYLAGAYHAADGNADRAVHNYAAGYYARGRRNVEATATPVNTFAFAPFNVFALAPVTPVKPTRKSHQAQAKGERVAFSSNAYNGQIDNH
jgi:soluble lytic murein transglycosylase-like protein